MLEQCLKGDVGYMDVYQPVKIRKLIFVCFHVNMCFILKFRTVLNTNITSEAISHTVSREYKVT